MLAKKALAAALSTKKVYVEDVFSTYLYTGTGASQTITNNIDLSTEGGLVWIKSRNDTYDHFLYDTLRGSTKSIQSSTTSAEQTYSDSLTAFNSTGFALGANVRVNANTTTYASWTLRKAKKFFDVVTFTTTTSTARNRRISHNLASVPGTIFLKRTDGIQNWYVYHRSLGRSKYLFLSGTDSEISQTNAWGTSDPTSTDFGIDELDMLGANRTYVAYLFAHDAGGFGDAGSDSIIKCGSFTTTGSAIDIDLGWEPQWILFRRTNSTGDWMIVDTMRGLSHTQWVGLEANNTNTDEVLSSGYMAPTATGWRDTFWSSGQTVIYIAIRRGPMKTPTDATKVFAPFYVNQSAGTKNTTDFPVDAMIIRSPSAGENNHLVSRLTGVSTDTTDSGRYLYTHAVDAEASGGLTRGWDNTGFRSTSGYAGYNVIYLPFRRAPGFFDVVCWTGTGSNIAVTHSLGVTPEFIIGKARDYTSGWICYHKDLGSTGGYPNYIILNSTNASGSGASTIWRGVSSTTFSYGTNATLNLSGINYVAYLFASVSGVSKVGSYTGNGSNQTINCGFTNGARLILIRRTDVAEDWYVFNSARGIVSGNDPFFYLNSTSAEGTSQDIIDPDNSGFIVNNVAGQNTNGATYIYLAIA